MRDTADVLDLYEEYRKPPPGLAWTDARIDELKRLAGQGQSASYIADAMGGVTRNAVIGKAHRLGVKIGRAKTSTPEQRRAFREKTRPKLMRALVEARGYKYTGKDIGRSGMEQKAQMARALVTADARPQTALMVQLLDLKPHHCRWPIGTPGTPDFGFCGCDKASIGSYCQHHAEMSWRERQPGVVPVNAFIDFRYRKVV